MAELEINSHKDSLQEKGNTNTTVTNVVNVENTEKEPNSQSIKNKIKRHSKVLIQIALLVMTTYDFITDIIVSTALINGANCSNSCIVHYKQQVSHGYILLSVSIFGFLMAFIQKTFNIIKLCITNYNKCYFCPQYFHPNIQTSDDKETDISLCKEDWYLTAASMFVENVTSIIITMNYTIKYGLSVIFVLSWTISVVSFFIGFERLFVTRIWNVCKKCSSYAKMEETEHKPSSRCADRCATFSRYCCCFVLFPFAIFLAIMIANTSNINPPTISALSFNGECHAYEWLNFNDAWYLYPEHAVNDTHKIAAKCSQIAAWNGAKGEWEKEETETDFLCEYECRLVTQNNDYVVSGIMGPQWAIYPLDEYGNYGEIMNVSYVCHQTAIVSLSICNI